MLCIVAAWIRDRVCAGGYLDAVMRRGLGAPRLVMTE